MTSSTSDIKISKLTRSKNQIFCWFLGILSLIYCLLMILPWNPQAYGFDLDQSWASALHIAIAQGMQFGRDFIYTYGPYGYTQVDLYFPDTYVSSFCWRLFIALAVWLGLLRIMRYCLARCDKSVLFLIPLFGFFPNQFPWLGHFQFVVITLPLIIYFYVGTNVTPALVATIFAMALVSLVKHTYLVPSLGFVIVITIDEICRQRRFPRILPLYLIAIAFLWIFAGQEIANFPSYIVNGLEIIKGYSGSMAKFDPWGQIAAYLISTSLFCLLIAATEWKYRQIWGLLPSLGLAIILFISFKGAFVRHDGGHALMATFNTTPIALMFVAMLWPQIRSYGWQLGKSIKVTGTLWCGGSLLLLFIMGSIILHHNLDYGYGTYSLDLLKLPAIKLSEATALIGGKVNLQQKFDLASQNIRDKNPLPNLSGKVDLYPDEIAVIFAYGLDYQPRPVIQSFSAYTDKLAEINANHLESNNAAETILFDIYPIDRRLPSVADGLSWPELLTHYDIKDIEGRYLALKRNRQPRSYSLTPPIKTKVPLGEWFELPDESFLPLWAKIDLNPNFLGKLASAALKLPYVYMKVETAEGKERKYRLITDILDRGFLISPVLSNRWDFLDFANSDWHQKLKWSQVKRIKISNKGLNTLLYPHSYEISLSSLDFPRQDFSQVNGWESWHQNTLKTGTTIQPINGALEKLELPHNKHGWSAHAPMKIKVKLSDTAERLSFNFGIADGAWQSGATDGVKFRIAAYPLNGGREILFSRKLKPVSRPQDRGVQHASIDLSTIDTHEVILETFTGDNDQWDWSYWSELTTQ